MAIFPSRVAAVLLLGGLFITIQALDFKLEHHLEHFIAVRNPSTDNKTPWIDARNYIFDQLQSYGLEAKFQPFNTSISDKGEAKTVKGQNIIGIAEGPPGGSIILVGADYDTRLQQNSPLEDNGAGVAAMLEIARNFMENIYRNNNYDTTGTVIFVAFDINTKEYDPPSAGQPGTYHFLHQWLWPYIQQTGNIFNGAFILDSISKYNIEVNSQVLPAGFDKVFPTANEDIIRGGRKGDFISLITRKSEASALLSQTLFDNYNKDRRARMFRLLDLTVQDGVEVNEETFKLFNHQASYHFWTFQPASENMSLPAILLSDTDIYRKPGDTCPSHCVASAFLTTTKTAFITKTSEALLQTLADLQTNRPHSLTSGIGLASSSSSSILVAMVILSRIFQ